MGYVNLDSCGLERIIMKPDRADIGRFRADQLSFPKLLQTMRRPPENAGDGEGGSKQFIGQSHAMQQKSGIVLHIGVEPAIRLAFAKQAKRSSFDAPGKVVELPVASG